MSNKIDTQLQPFIATNIRSDATVTNCHGLSFPKSKEVAS